MFKKPAAPAPQQVPIQPAAPENTEAAKARDDAAVSAVAETKSRGRASTMVAGRIIAQEEQYERGLLKSRQRRAVSDELGL
jgi:hypothetical protein